MLSAVLQKSDCAACRFCCAFRRCSLWETPLFPAETAQKYTAPSRPFSALTVNGAPCAKMELEGRYQTDDSEEEAPCFFLKEGVGCTLNENEKPFDCKIWPLRVMRQGERLVIALTPTCPVIQKVGTQKMKELVQNGLADVIFDYAAAHPFIIKAYREDFPVLCVKES